MRDVRLYAGVAVLALLLAEVSLSGSTCVTVTRCVHPVIGGTTETGDRMRDICLRHLGRGWSLS